MNALWFTARGAGLSALVVLSLSVVLGSVASTRMMSPSLRIVVQYLHRTAAVLGLLLILVHVTTIVLDAKSHVGVAGAFIPFASTYRPRSVALGSIAAYLFLAAAAMGAARGRMAGSARAAAAWRLAHASAYGTWVIAIGHGLLAGTDRGQRWVLVLFLLCIAAVVAAAAARLLDTGRIDSPDRGRAGSLR